MGLALAIIAGCAKKRVNRDDEGFLQVKGSDTIVNTEQMLSETFMKLHPRIYVAVTGGGTGVGIASLINQTCEVAAASREMKPKEIQMAEKRGVHPKEITVAYDGVAVIVHPANPLERLSLKQLHDIFTGKVANWKHFGGKDLGIVLLSREVSSGTHAYFKEEVVRLGKKESTEEFAPQTLLLTSSQTIVEETVTNEGAIGYLGMGYVSPRIKTLLLSKKGGDFQAATMENVLSKKYPLSRPLFFYTNGAPRGITKLFVDYTLSPAGQRLFAETGFVPLHAGETH